MDEALQDGNATGDLRAITLHLPQELVDRIDRIARREHRHRRGQISYWLEHCVETAEREDAAPR